MTDLIPPVAHRSAVAPLAGLESAILIHAPQSNVNRVAAFARNNGISAVYTVSRGNKLAAAKRLLEEHRAIAGKDTRIIFDANRYSGKNRLPGDAPLSEEWVSWQLEQGSPVAITDTGYIDFEHIDQIETVLNRTADIASNARGNVAAMLPLDYLILKNAGDRVRDYIDRIGVPVAVAVGHSGDPFNSVDTVRGLLHVVDSSVRTALLRTDLSAVGAVAAGASFGAIGTSTTLRHIWPPKGGGPTQPGVAVLVPRLMSYHRLERIPLAAAQVPQDYFFCGCNICQGGMVHERATELTAHEHSVSAIATIAAGVLSESPEDSLKSFRSKAMVAQSYHSDIQVVMEDARWAPPASLNAWVKALDGR
jgi:hypothetical protein